MQKTTRLLVDSTHTTQHSDIHAISSAFSRLHHRPRSPLILPRILARHAHLIARPLTALPEPRPAPRHERRMARPAVLRPEVLLARAVAADHAVGILVRVVADGVVAFVARENFAAAREPEPAVRFGIVRAAAAAGELLADLNAKLLLLLPRTRLRRTNRGGADLQELDFWNAEAHPLVALAAYRQRRFASDRHDSRRRVRR